MPHRESHRVERIGWLRAAVLGANDGLVSTASLMVGVAAAARPIQAAITSAATFSAGAALPLIVAAFAPVSSLALWVAGSALLGLALLGALGARAGGAPIGRSAGRVVFWGALAMAITAGVGRLFGVAA